MTISTIVYLCLLASLCSTPALAHGTLGSVNPERGCLMTASYDDGEPMAYAAASVFHGEDPLPFQTGRTDKNGRFMFFPDAPGSWKTVVKDDMGHALTVKTQISQSLAPDASEGASHASGAKTTRTLAGLSVIFFLSGLGFWWTGRTLRNSEGDIDPA